jgi:hypothetical protein
VYQAGCRPKKIMIMKKLLFPASITCLLFIACGTPTPATTIPSDSIMDSGKPAPDSPALDSTLKKDSLPQAR